MRFSKGELQKLGFEGFKPIQAFKKNSNSFGIIPEIKGVYVVYRVSIKNPVFLRKSTGGHLKGKDPTVSIAQVKLKWAGGANVIYIGQTRQTLRMRITQYIRFGRGHRAPHWGGRYIWQLKDQNDLLVAWKKLATQDPRGEESRLIKEFKANFGKKPFANL